MVRRCEAWSTAASLWQEGSKRPRMSDSELARRLKQATMRRVVKGRRTNRIMAVCCRHCCNAAIQHRNDACGRVAPTQLPATLSLCCFPPLIQQPQPSRAATVDHSSCLRVAGSIVNRSWAMSASRPKRAAAADADWLIRQRKELLASASSASASASAAAHPASDDDDDESYIPSAAASKRQRAAAQPFHTADEQLQPAVALSTSTGGSSSSEYDVWDEHEQDSRHQRSRATGCFVIAPIVTQPKGYRSEQQAREAEKAQQPVEAEHEQSSGSKHSHRGKRASAAAAVARTTTAATVPADGPLTLLPSGLTAQFATEPLSAVQARDAALNGSLQSLSSYMSSLLSTSHQSTFAAIGEWLAALPPPAPYESLNCLMPAAFLYAGVDADDQPLLFSELSSHILDRSSPSPASSTASSSSSPSAPFCLPLLLSASQCQTVEKAVRHILVSYMTTYPSSTTSSSRSRRSDHNAHYLYSLEQSAARHKQLNKELWPSLAAWWTDKHEQMADDALPRLLLIFTDPHAFAPATLSQLLYVLMCHEQLRHLPWVWMFGLGVDARVMYGLDERVTSRIRVANFHLAASSSLLSPLLASLLLSPSVSLPLPLLSPATLSYLAVAFASNHTSLSSFALALRALMCDYYGSVPFSDVVHAWLTGKGSQQLQSMTNAGLMEMQRVYGTDGLGGDNGAAAVSAAQYRERVLEWLERWEVERSRFLFGCRTLWRLVSALVGERTDMSTDERGVLLTVYGHREETTQSIEPLPLYQAVLTALRSHQSSAVIAPLNAVVANVRQWCEQQTDTSSTSLSRLVDELQESLDNLLSVDESAVATASLSAKPVRAKTAKERRVALSGGIDAARKQYVGVRDEIARCLTALLDALLPRLHALPLAQLVICHSPSLPALMSFQQRYAVMDAITASSASSSSSPSALLGPQLDDMRVVLQLYDESGVSMQLADTFTTFASSRLDRRANMTSHPKRSTVRKGKRQAEDEEAAANGEEKDEKEPSASDMKDDFVAELPAAVRTDLYVRFSACVDALRWCGFIRPAAGKRGSEEMIKLVYNTT